MALVTLLTLGFGLVALTGCGSDEGTEASPTAGASAAAVEIAGKTITADAAVHDMLPDTIGSSGVVRVACDVPYPPWQMYEELGTDKYTGVEIDMGNALAAKMGVQFVWQNSIFDSIIPAMQADKVDAVMATMWDNVERQEVVDFVDWAQDGGVLVVLKGNPKGVKGIDDLSGRTVAVQTGTLFIQQLQQRNEELLAAGKPEMEILQFAKDAEALLAVKSGKAAVQMTTAPGAAYMVQTEEGADYELVDDPAAPYTPSLVGVGVLKDSPQLRDAIKAAFDSLMADGTYTAILDKYQVGPLLAVDECVVNAATQ